VQATRDHHSNIERLGLVALWATTLALILALIAGATLTGSGELYGPRDARGGDTHTIDSVTARLRVDHHLNP
jgi:hypothetical protein